MFTAPAFPTTATNKGYAKGLEMGWSAEDLDVVPKRELMDEAGRQLGNGFGSEGGTASGTRMPTLALSMDCLVICRRSHLLPYALLRHFDFWFSRPAPPC